MCPDSLLRLWTVLCKSLTYLHYTGVHLLSTGELVLLSGDASSATHFGIGTRAFAVAVLRPGINCRCTYENGCQLACSRRH